MRFNDAQEIVDRVCRLLADYDMAKAISGSARITAAGYSCERVAMETAAFYERLLDMR